mgnify:CR=1 FL=1
MKTRKPLHWFLVALASSLVVGGWGCGSRAEKVSPPAAVDVRAPGKLYGHLEVVPGSFDTAEYIPTKIRFELDKQLTGKGLLAGPHDNDGTLTVTVKTKAYYAGTTASYSCPKCYTMLSSLVVVTNPGRDRVLAEKVFETYGGSLGVVDLTDFSEIEHAKDIAQFLEAIVK